MIFFLDLTALSIKIFQQYFEVYLVYIMPTSLIFLSSFLECYNFKPLELVTRLGVVIISLTLILFYDGFSLFGKQLIVVYATISLFTLLLFWFWDLLNWDSIRLEKIIKSKTTNSIVLLFYLVFLAHFFDYGLHLYIEMQECEAAQALLHEEEETKRLAEETRQAKEQARQAEEIKDLKEFVRLISLQAEIQGACIVLICVILIKCFGNI